MNERRIHQLFFVSLIIKGVNAAIEVLGGVVLAFASQQELVAVANWLTHRELVEDPHDLVATTLLHFAQTFSVSSQAFYAYYLVSHGAIKLVMVAGLLANRLWAYPFGLLVMGLFITYQIYEYGLTHSLGMLSLTLFDIIVVWLIWHEYRLVRAHGTGWRQ